MRFRPIILILFLFLGSCLKDKDYDFSDVTLTPAVAFPLAFGNISILDLISEKDSSYLKVYPDGLLYFYYHQTLASRDVRDLFDIPNNSSTPTFDLPPGTLPANPADVQYAVQDYQIDLNLNPEKLSEILLKTGSLNYNISISPANPNLPIEVIITMSDVVDKTTLAPLTLSSAAGTGSKPLANYIMKMSQNRFNANIKLVLKKHANAVFIPAGSKVNVQLTFAGLDFNYIKGFFGDQIANLPEQSIDLSVFSSSLKKSNVSFVQPVVKMQVVNDYGSSCEVTFSKLEAKKSSTVLPLQISPSSPVALGYPTLFGNSATTSVTVANAVAVIDFAPTQLHYVASARINKGLSSASNFMSDTSKLRVTLTTEVPLYGRTTGVKMIDTLSVDLNDLNKSNVSKASLRIRAINELPLDANVQIYLADASYHIQDSLFTPVQTYIVKSSTVTPAGELQKAGVSDLQLGLEPARISKLFESKYLIIRTTFNTTKDANGGLLNVKFKAAYKLKLNVGLNAQLNLKIE